MGKSIVTQAVLAKDEYLHSKVVKLGKLPNYYRIGNGTMNKHSIESIDLLDEVMSMTKAEQLVISTIKDAYPWDNQTNEIYVPLSKLFNKTKSAVFLKGFKSLKQKNLVRRTKQSHYMINPSAYIPFDYEKAKQLWDSVESDNG